MYRALFYFFSGSLGGGVVGLLEDPGVPDGELEDGGGVLPGAPVDGGVAGVPGLVILSLEPDFGLSPSRLQPAAASVSAATATSIRACLVMSGLL